MPVTEQLAVLAFADGTSATLSWTLDVAGGVVQSFIWTIPSGHSVDVVARNASGTTIFSHTAVGDGLQHTLAVAGGWTTGTTGNPAAGWSLSLSGS